MIDAAPGRIANSQRKSPHFRAGSDFLTVEAVEGEPVSLRNSLHQGIYQGIFQRHARPPARMFLIRSGLRPDRSAPGPAYQGISFAVNRESYGGSREDPRAPSVAAAAAKR
jgi:hypothetical protein